MKLILLLMCLYVAKQKGIRLGGLMSPVRDRIRTIWGRLPAADRRAVLFIAVLFVAAVSFGYTTARVIVQEIMTH